MVNDKVALFATVDIRGYNLAMKAITNSHIPEAVADTLNGVADSVTRNQIRNVKNDLIVRTKFTINSMTSAKAKPYQALNKAGGRDLKRMFSRAGTTSRYLWLQEEDQTVRGLDGPVPIPTLRARIGKNLRKAIHGTYRLKKSQSLKNGPIRFTNKKGDGAGAGFIGTPKGGGIRGIYQRMGGWIKMIRNLENETVRIKGVGFHSRAVRKFGTANSLKMLYTFKLNQRIRRMR